MQHKPNGSGWYLLGHWAVLMGEEEPQAPQFQSCQQAGGWQAW